MLYDLSEEEFASRMKEYCSQNPRLVRANPILDGDGLLLKYRKDVFFKNLWSEEILECRGTIVDAKTFVPIQRPFTKIFSATEKFAPVFSPDECVIACEKINGYMLSVTIHKKELLVSTTGTTDSVFAEFAKTKFKEHFEHAKTIGLINEDSTTLFEIVDSEFDPHIIKDDDGLWVLGTREKKWISETEFNYFNYSKEFIRYPRIFIASFSEIEEMNKTWNGEGFIVRSLEGKKEIKMKSPFYTSIKWIARKNEKVLLSLLDLFNKGTLKVPHWFEDKTNELIQLGFQEIQRNKNQFLSLTEQQKVQFLRSIFEKAI
jgi:hypothetical protein